MTRETLTQCIIPTAPLGAKGLVTESRICFAYRGKSPKDLTQRLQVDTKAPGREGGRQAWLL